MERLQGRGPCFSVSSQSGTQAAMFSGKKTSTVKVRLYQLGLITSYLKL